MRNAIPQRLIGALGDGVNQLVARTSALRTELGHCCSSVRGLDRLGERVVVVVQHPVDVFEQSRVIALRSGCVDIGAETRYPVQRVGLNEPCRLVRGFPNEVLVVRARCRLLAEY